MSDTPALIGLILDMDAGTLSVCLDGDYKNADIIFRGKCYQEGLHIKPCSKHLLRKTFDTNRTLKYFISTALVDKGYHMILLYIRSY